MLRSLVLPSPSRAALAALFLGAVAPLTGAQSTRSTTSGGPVVHPLRVEAQSFPSLGGVNQSVAVWIQLPASLSAATEVELVVAPRLPLLDVEVKPALQTVQPGTPARFLVNLGSRDCFVAGSFQLVFRESTTGAALGEIPVDVTRGAGETPRDLKLAALETLRDLRLAIATGADGVGDRQHATEELADAIEELEESLEPELWLGDGLGGIDPTHLDPERGAEVFHEERESAQEVFDAIRQGEISNPDLVADLIGVIDSLVTADRFLAEVQIQDAIAGNGEADELEDALAHFAEGEALVAQAGQTSDLRVRAALLYEAMDGAYRHAWKEAIDALGLD